MLRKWTTVGVVNSYPEAQKLQKKMRRKGYHTAHRNPSWRCPHHEHVTVKIKRTGPKGTRFKVIVDEQHPNAPGRRM